MNELDSHLKKIAEDKSLSYIQDYVPSAWLGHAPFFKFLIRETKPKVFVELGTHFGFSYFVACQTIEEMNLSTSCYAVDHWEGDKYTSLYDDSVYNSVVVLNQKYAHFSQLVRKSFLDARSYIPDPIDLLHIDGLHTYEAVKEDFESWLPKMHKDGIVLLHDIHVRRSDFGVYRFWAEVKKEFQTIEFVGSYGLGVIFLGEIQSQEIAILNEYFENGFGMQVQGVFADHSDIVVQSYGADLKSQLDQTSEQLRKILDSSSWAITVPLRKIKGFFRN